MLRPRIALLSAGVLAAGLLAVIPATAGHADVASRVEIPGLRAAASVVGWLTNDTYPVRSNPLDLVGATDSVTVLFPARRT